MQTAPHLTLSQVADQVGYADLPSFSKAFTKKMGQSPSAWRLQMGTI
jgi:AraC-like DNA-binding protein